MQVQFRANFLSARVGLTGSRLSGERLVVYPNPAEDRLTVEATGGDEEVMLYDLLGRAKFRARLVSGKAVLDTSRLPPGVFVVGLETRAHWSRYFDSKPVAAQLTNPSASRGVRDEANTMTTKRLVSVR